MDEWYELWDVDSGNLVGDFPDIQTAVSFLRAAVEEHGADVLVGYLLAPSNRHSEPFEGAELLSLVATVPSSAEAVI